MCNLFRHVNPEFKGNRSNILILFKDLPFLIVVVVKINKIKTNLYFHFFHQALVQVEINIRY
jgi:hypothetical protein